MIHIYKDVSIIYGGEDINDKLDQLIYIRQLLKGKIMFIFLTNDQHYMKAGTYETIF